MFLVMAGLRPCPAHEVMIVQSSPLAAYQRATSGFNQAFATLSLPGVASIQTTETVILDPGESDVSKSVAQKYQDLQPNLVVAVGSAALKAAKDLPAPIIYLMTPDPEAIVPPRATIAGVRMQVSPAEQIAAIRATLPAVHTLGLLHNPATSGDFPDLAREAAKRLHLSLIGVAAKNDREAVLSLTAKAPGLDAILLTPDQALITPTLLESLAMLSLERRIPLIAFAPKYLEQGAAMAVFTTPEESGREAAGMAKRLLASSSRDGVKTEYARTATVLTNKRILHQLGLVAADGPQEGGDTP